MMVSSAIIQENVIKYLSDGEQRSIQEIKAYLSTVKVIGFSEGQFSGSMNTLQRNGSIKKNERGIYSIRHKEEEKMRKCFVISPIGDKGSEIRKNADQLLKYIIEPICNDCGFEVVRIDQLNDANSITQTIIDSLESSDLAIADLSGQNANVFYEMGYRQRTGKPIIHLKMQGDSIPFDVSSIRTYDYDLTDLDSVEAVKDRLKKTINAFSFDTQDNASSGVEVFTQETSISSTIPILYEILDGIEGLRNEVKSNNDRALETVIKTMQNSQPQMSKENVLLATLIPMLLQNPQMLQQLIELNNKLPAQQVIFNKKIRS